MPGQRRGFTTRPTRSNTPRLHDAACALEHTAPFGDDAECVRWLRYPEPPDRR
jgi:hypothetical protein